MIDDGSRVCAVCGQPTAENLAVGVTVRHLNGFVGVVVPKARRLPENQVNVMHLDGSIQTVESAHLTVLFDPRDSVIPPE